MGPFGEETYRRRQRFAEPLAIDLLFDRFDKERAPFARPTSRSTASTSSLGNTMWVRIVSSAIRVILGSKIVLELALLDVG